MTYPGNGVVTVTVSSAAGTPHGQRHVGGGGGRPQYAVLDGSGVATFTLPSPSPGIHNLSASYAPQGGSAGSGPTAGTLTVDSAPTITSSAGSTFTAGVEGTFTVTTAGFPTPSLGATGSLPGGVTFTDNGMGRGRWGGGGGGGELCADPERCQRGGPVPAALHARREPGGLRPTAVAGAGRDGQRGRRAG